MKKSAQAAAALLCASARALSITAKDGYKLSLITSKDTSTDDAVLLLHGAETAQQSREATCVATDDATHRQGIDRSRATVEIREFVGTRRGRGRCRGSK